MYVYQYIYLSRIIFGYWLWLHYRNRALVKINEEFKPTLKEMKYLTRDARVVERKKYGKPKARKSFQFSKLSRESYWCSCCCRLKRNTFLLRLDLYGATNWHFHIVSSESFKLKILFCRYIQLNFQWIAFSNKNFCTIEAGWPWKRVHGLTELQVRLGIIPYFCEIFL